ncbi:putative F-box/LRR-repeat protein At5g02700 [Lolium rigidum]|uniref:putative F-box/LRR-repeat protein At5g02700 n=1 Tax=Lolium rigidum TaxID=89674 RepID=UPI001F5D9389|nr:putative F-box/LRR-repeat protein At5g02700 [Lolium rigidum]
MEMLNLMRSRFQVQEKREDRLSGLPADVLHSILGVLPLKDAVRTSALSTRWAHKWLHALAASAVLDFTDRDLVRGQSPAQITATVDRVLAIHGAAPIHVFRVALSPLDELGQNVVVGWVAAALGRGAREVGVDLARRGVLDYAKGRASLLQLPGDLFQVENSLSVLSLGRCSLRDVPPGAAGLAGLTSLSLDRVDVTDDDVRDVVSECRLLEFLSLRSCHLLVSVRVAGERLRGLEIVGCLSMRHLRVAAPALESLAYHGEILYYRDDAYETAPVEFIGKDNTRRNGSDAVTPELRDAYLSHLGLGGYDELIHEFAYSGFLEEVAHARILTLCSVGLLHIEETRIFYELTMYTPNLEEVQLLMDTMSDGDVNRFCGFFGLTEPPLLERLFVRVNILFLVNAIHCRLITSANSRIVLAAPSRRLRGHY